MIAALTNILSPTPVASAPEDQIIAHYRAASAIPLKPLRTPMGDVLTTVTQGLGDTMMMTDLPAASAKQGKQFQSFSPSRHFLPLMAYNPHYKDVKDKAYLLNAPDLVRQYDCGNGHYLQRIRRAFGLGIDDKPHGFIAWKGMRSRQRVVLHFDAGVHVRWQRKKVHPRARMIYPETKLMLEQFIADNRDLEFIEIGETPLNVKGSRHVHTANTTELVERIAASNWFVGIISGPMHVATALGLKCVVILNFPPPSTIFVPTLKVTGQIESEWLYPQNVHLHQEGGSTLVPRITVDNLKRAFAGEIYPFWSDKYLALIHERL